MKLKKILYLCFIIFSLLVFFNKSQAEELGDLGGAVKESVQETINQVKNVDLGEAESDLAKGIDDAMGGMADGMEFALQALEGGDAETAIRTMELLETTMDMAIQEIPQEEFMDFSKINFDDFSQEELAAAQSMMGDMMKDSMQEMSQMMQHMDHVGNAGFDVGGFMGSMQEGGFGFEKMFSDNMENMGSMFGQDMQLMDTMVGDDLFGDGQGFGDFEQMMVNHEGMNIDDMMEHMQEMENMSSMMSEQMNFENFAEMTEMMDGNQMEMMTEGMMQMMGEGHFDQFGNNMEIMGAMIKGEAPESMDEDHQDFFGDSQNDEQMMQMMSEHSEQIGVSFEELSPEQQEMFMQESAETAWIGQGTEDMSNFDSSWQGEGGQEFGPDTGLGMGDGMGAGGKPMFGFGGEQGGDMFGGQQGGDMFGGEQGGDMFGEAFGGEGHQGEGMFDDKGFQGGGEHDQGPESGGYGDGNPDT